MAEAALRKSRDVGELKKFRAAIKGQVTGALNKLETLFAQKVAEDFDHGRILVTEVNEVEFRLKEKPNLLRSYTTDAASLEMLERTLIKRSSYPVRMMSMSRR